MLLASAVPVTKGVASLVMLPLAGVETTGADGAVVSMVKVFIAEALETLPPASVAVTCTVWLPSAIAADGVKEKGPVAPAMVVPMGKPSTYTVTVVLASAVPVTGGRLLLVRLPFAGVLRVGAVGGVASTVKVFTTEAGEGLPAASAAVALTVCEPGVRALAETQDHAPSTSAEVTQTAAPSSEAVTRAPGSEVPVSVGRGPVVLPFAGEVTTGAAGERVSTRKALVFDLVGLPTTFAVAR